MTGYTVHTGSNEKFSTNWDRIFSGEGAPPAKPKPATARKSPAKKAAAKKKKGR
jgi:hypothetical protein